MSGLAGDARPRLYSRRFFFTSHVLERARRRIAMHKQRWVYGLVSALLIAACAGWIGYEAGTAGGRWAGLSSRSSAGRSIS